MTFSDQAKQLKEKSNMTLHDIAEACNISESTASRYISGAIVPQEDMARKMLEALGGGDAPVKIEGEEDVQTALAMIREVYEARINDLNLTIKDLKERIKHERAERWVIMAVLLLVIAAFFTMIFIDLANGNIGWFRH